MYHKYCAHTNTQQHNLITHAYSSRQDTLPSLFLYVVDVLQRLVSGSTYAQVIFWTDIVWQEHFPIVHKSTLIFSIHKCFQHMSKFGWHIYLLDWVCALFQVMNKSQSSVQSGGSGSHPKVTQHELLVLYWWQYWVRQWEFNSTSAARGTVGTEKEDVKCSVTNLVAIITSRLP